MTTMSNKPFDLNETYVHLSGDGAATAVRIDESFWARIADRRELHEGRLMGSFRTAEDPSHWEMHPEGDEILFLVSGSMDVVLREQDVERTVALRERGVCIVPRGTWHRQIVHAPSEFVFITPGQGTLHRQI